jgi:hypothetical protein
MTLVQKDAVAESIVCGDDPGAHIEQVRAFVDAGVDEVYVQQIGADVDGFFRTWAEKVLPEFR